MTKEEFKKFCKEQFYSRGFTKVKKMFYFDNGKDILCGIDLQKSNFGNTYYINVSFFMKNFIVKDAYPSYLEADFNRRIMVMSKKQTYQGEVFMTPQIEYEEYENQELGMYFQQNFEEWIMPAIERGMDYIIERSSDDFFVPNYLKRDNKFNCKKIMEE